MFDIDNLNEVKIIRQNERQQITLLQATDGTKYLRRDILDDKREIYKALSNIKHPGIPTIFYVGLTDHTIVIEQYIEGTTLAECIENNVKFSKKQVKSIVKQLLSSLGAIHREKIIHRDVKPENVLIDEKNNVYLIDYDIARIERKQLKKDTDTMGTFGYAPIEQFGMMPTDCKTDIYAFGMTLKALLDSLGFKGFLYRIAEKCTRLDPAQRYKNASTVKKVLLFNDLIYPLLGTVVAVGLTGCIAWGVLTNIHFDSNVIVDNKVSDDINQISINKNIDIKPDDKTNSTPDGKTIPTPYTNKHPEKEEDKPVKIEEIEAEAVVNEILNEKNEESVEIVEADSGRVTDLDEQPVTEEKNKIEVPEKNEEKEVETFNGDFNGFSSGKLENEYCKPENTINIGAFSTDLPYEHILFVEDMNKKGKIKFGKENAVVNADITLSNGVLNLSLDDGKGHKLKNAFKYNGSSAYEKNYTSNLRKNADIICHDFDGDGYKELIVGVNECSVSKFNNYIQQNTNYCVAWCIRYDKERGFVLCNGEMFNKYGKFSIFSGYNTSLHMQWQEDGDVMYYDLEGDRIVANR